MEMLLSLTILVILTIVFIYLSGWFSGTETALTNLSHAQLAEMRENNEKNIRYLIELKKDMNRTLITILIGNNIVNIVLSAIAALIANELFHTLGVSIMIGIVTFLIIIFGEIMPKSVAIADSKKVSLKNAKAIYYLMRILNPIITTLDKLSHRTLRLIGRKIKHPSIVSDESIKGLATLGEDEGVIKTIEKEIIHKVFRFGDIKIKDVMVPMDKVFYIDNNYTIEKASEIVTQHGFTRIPIINESRKAIGIINSKDMVSTKGDRIDSIMKSPFIVSVNSDVTTVFTKMKENRVHIAIVKDEENKHIGIVTLEDILEELVGEIYDEHYEVKYNKEDQGKTRGGITKQQSKNTYKSKYV
jgi:CBS domain containing-hemolysin-like protein